MATTRQRPSETREMRLFSRLIERSEKVTDQSLPQFIAARRAPGKNWRTWDEVIFELRDVSGEIVTDITMRRWAKTYGIPEYTEGDNPTVKNRFSGETVSAAEFNRALKRAGISF